MTSHSEEYISIVEICACVKRLGYGASQIVRLYGEDFEVISDPFAEAGGIAITVRTKKDSVPRMLQIPTTILRSVKGHLARAA